MSKGPDTTEKTVPKQLTPWQPGQSGNPAGRPKGSRNKLSEAFLSALSEDFEQNGVAVIETVRAEKPAEYLKIIAAIVPKQLEIRETSLEDMSDEELLESLDAVRSLAASLVGATTPNGGRKTSRDTTSRTKPN
jgi:hypothetical protein